MNQIAKRKERELYKKEGKRRPLDIKQYEVKKPAELLDFLYSVMPDTPKKNVKAMLTRHCVSIDGAPISQYNFALSPGDTVIISKTSIKPKTNKKELDIIFENSEFIVINKPAGMLSIASDKEKSYTAYRLVTQHVQQQDRHNRIFVVHRIDKETSGVLMFCKNEEFRDLVQEKWNECAIDRKYYAVCDGVLKEKSGTLKCFLKLNSANMMSVVHGKDTKGAQFCITNYKVIKENKDYSLLDVSIESGRKNQIRVMLGSIGHFIAGDDKYGDPTDPINRLCLHAYNLTFKHPIMGKVYKFESPMPESFNTIFSSKTIKKPVKYNRGK